MDEDGTGQDDAAAEDPHAPWRPPGWTPPETRESPDAEAPVRQLTPPEMIWSPASLREAPSGEPPAPAVVVPDVTDGGAESPAAVVTSGGRQGRRRLRIAAVAVVVAALIAVPVAGVLYLRAAGGTGDVLVGRAVPGTVAVYASVRLDPSLSTKQNLRDLLDRFPSVHNDPSTTVTSWVRDAVQGTGLDYDRDVQPWLGTQIAAIAMTGSVSGSAALLVSSDDGKARAALQSTEVGAPGRGLTWSTVDHNGVGINVGTHEPAGFSGYGCSGCRPSVGYVWAVVDHVVVVGSGQDVVASVVDTLQGRTPALGAASLYTDTMSRFSGDRVAEVFVDAAPLLDALHQTLTKNGAASVQVVGGDIFQALDAYRSLGMAVTVASDHVALDAVTLTDSAKLPARPASSQASLASWLPASSVAVVSGRGGTASGPAGALAAIAGLSTFGTTTVRPPDTVFPTLMPRPGVPVVPGSVSGGAIAVAPGATVRVTPAPSRSGTIPQTVPLRPPPTAVVPATSFPPVPIGPSLDPAQLSHLVGPSAAAVWAGADGSPRAALVLTGDGSGGLGDTLDRLVRALSGGGVESCSGTVPPGGGAPALHCITTMPTATRTEHGGVTITSYVHGAWAVVDGVGVLATSPQAVADILDAHSSGTGADRASGFGHSAAVSAESGLWIDVQATIGLVRSTLGSGTHSALDDAMPDLRPLKTLVATAGGDASAQTFHLELTVG